MPKVYLVTSGCYSDYSVDKVFSSLELAEKWVGDKPSHYEIDVRDIDDMSGSEANVLRSTYVGRRWDGTEIGHYKVSDLPHIIVRIDRHSQQPYPRNIQFFIYIPTLDLSTALKTSSEILARMKALDRFEPGSYAYDTLERLD
jgi:hypothetical protein